MERGDRAGAAHSLGWGKAVGPRFGWGLNADRVERSPFWSGQRAVSLTRLNRMEVKVRSSRFSEILAMTDTRPQENVEEVTQGRIDMYGLCPRVPRWH